MTVLPTEALKEKLSGYEAGKDRYQRDPQAPGWNIFELNRVVIPISESASAPSAPSAQFRQSFVDRAAPKMYRLDAQIIEEAEGYEAVEGRAEVAEEIEEGDYDGWYTSSGHGEGRYKHLSLFSLLLVLYLILFYA
jgi:hypothetical protein